MKKTILVIALASITSVAFACGGPSCPAAANGGATGSIAGGSFNKTEAYSVSSGNGASVSAAGSSSYSAAGLYTNVETNSNNRNGTASTETQLSGYTANGADAFAVNKSVGHATGGAQAVGVAASGVEGAAFGTVSANRASGIVVTGLETGTVAGAAAQAGRNQGGAGAAEAGSLVNVVGGISVKSCGDIKSVEGYVADTKLVETNAATLGNAVAGSAGSATAGGLYFGRVGNTVSRDN